MFILVKHVLLLQYILPKHNNSDDNDNNNDNNMLPYFVSELTEIF